MRPKTSLTDNDIHRLMDQIDGAAEEQARYQRCPFETGSPGRVPRRELAVRCRYTHPAGGSGEALVALRNIGASGTAFVCFGMLHPGTKLELRMRDLAERQVTLHAVVSACTHVKGMAHDLDAAFPAPVDIEQFVPEQRIRHFTLRRVTAVDTLAGTLLLCNDDALENKVLELHLEKSKLELTRAVLSGQMLDAVQQADFDVVVLNWDSEAFGAEGLGRLRGTGYEGPVVLVVAGLDTPQQDELAATLSAVVLPRPFRAEDVVKALARALTHGARRQRYPLISTLGTDERSTEIVRLYLTAAHRQMTELSQAGPGRNPEQLASVCRMLRDSGVSFGFDGISEMARAIVARVEAKDLADVDSQFRRLRLYVSRAASAYGNQDAAA